MTTERQQSVAHRARKPAPPHQRAHSLRRRGQQVVRWARLALWAAVPLLPVACYLVAADSEAFGVGHVDVVGTNRVVPEQIERRVRNAAGARLLETDLDAVRLAVESDGYVRSASVVRVLPDTLRVYVTEREPLVVVRLKNGSLAWVDTDAVVLEDYRPEIGKGVPPPLSGFDDQEAAERVQADNRDRVARYIDIRDALTGDNLWDRIDEVDMTYLRDVKVHLADSPVVVRVGDRDFRARLETALTLLDAVRRGDTNSLARYHVQNVGQLIAASDSIDFIDVTRPNGSITLSYRGSIPARRPAVPTVAVGTKQRADGRTDGPAEPTRARSIASAKTESEGVRRER